MTAARDLMVAIHEGLQSAGIEIHDHVRDGVMRPYVSFGVLTLRPWSGQEFAGHEIRLMLDFWSEAPGRREVLGLMDQVRSLICAPGFAVAGYRLVLATEELSEILRETDARIFHGVMRLRVLMHEL